METREYLTLSDVATELKMDVETIRRYARSGKLPASKLGRGYRVKRTDLEAFLEASKHKATQA